MPGILRSGAKLWMGFLAVLPLVGLIIFMSADVDEDARTEQSAPPSDTPASNVSAQTDDADVQAVIEGLRGSVNVDFSMLDDVLPLRKTPNWQTHAIAFDLDQENALLAIVIDDMGMVQAAEARLGKLPKPLTLAYLPYAPGVDQLAKRAHKLGHELMVHMPMEPKNKAADPGPEALLEDIDQQEFDRRLAHNLTRFDHFVGINNHMGSLLTEDPSRMVRVMASLKRGGFLFLDSYTSPNTVGPSAARAGGVPWLRRNVFIDNDRDPDLIRVQLEKAVRAALRNGRAIAIGHPYPETLDVLVDWAPSLKARGVRLAPISALMAQKLEEAEQRESTQLAGRGGTGTR